jgi:type III secretory pathway component EscT
MGLPGLVDVVLDEARSAGLDLSRLGVGVARVLPTALFVPAFGLGFLTVPLRIAIGVGLAVAIVPAIPPDAVSPAMPWVARLLAAFLRGIPLALAASVSLWAAMVAGGVADTAIGSARLRPPPTALGPRVTPLATLFGLFAAIAFFETGGATRLLAGLSSDVASPSLQSAVLELAAGVGTGAAIGAPLLVVVVLLEVATRVAGFDRPSLSNEAVFAPLKSLVVLVASAALLERIAEALALGAARPF